MPMTPAVRITRLEKAVWDLAMMVGEGDPSRYVRAVNPVAAAAAQRFLEAMKEIEAEQPTK
jgi:hypothetical protein